MLSHDDLQYCVQVNGAVVNVRGKGDKLAVWVTDSANTEAVVSSDCGTIFLQEKISSKSQNGSAQKILPQMKIGKLVKERLEIPENQTIVFNVHKVVISFICNLKPGGPPSPDF